MGPLDPSLNLKVFESLISSLGPRGKKVFAAQHTKDIEGLVDFGDKYGRIGLTELGGFNPTRTIEENIFGTKYYAPSTGESFLDALAKESLLPKSKRFHTTRREANLRTVGVDIAKVTDRVDKHKVQDFFTKSSLPVISFYNAKFEQRAWLENTDPSKFESTFKGFYYTGPAGFSPSTTMHQRDMRLLSNDLDIALKQTKVNQLVTQFMHSGAAKGSPEYMLGLNKSRAAAATLAQTIGEKITAAASSGGKLYVDQWDIAQGYLADMQGRHGLAMGADFRLGSNIDLMLKAAAGIPELHLTSTDSLASQVLTSHMAGTLMGDAPTEPLKQFEANFLSLQKQYRKDRIAEHVSDVVQGRETPRGGLFGYGVGSREVDVSFGRVGDSAAAKTFKEYRADRYIKGIDVDYLRSQTGLSYDELSSTYRTHIQNYVKANAFIAAEQEDELVEHTLKSMYGALHPSIPAEDSLGTIAKKVGKGLLNKYSAGEIFGVVAGVGVGFVALRQVLMGMKTGNSGDTVYGSNEAMKPGRPDFMGALTPGNPQSMSLARRFKGLRESDGSSILSHIQAMKINTHPEFPGGRVKGFKKFILDIGGYDTINAKPLSYLESKLTLIPDRTLDGYIAGSQFGIHYNPDNGNFAHNVVAAVKALGISDIHPGVLKTAVLHEQAEHLQLKRLRDAVGVDKAAELIAPDKHGVLSHAGSQIIDEEIRAASALGAFSQFQEARIKELGIAEFIDPSAKKQLLYSYGKYFLPDASFSLRSLDISNANFSGLVSLSKAGSVNKTGLRTNLNIGNSSGMSPSMVPPGMRQYYPTGYNQFEAMNPDHPDFMGGRTPFNPQSIALATALVGITLYGREVSDYIAPTTYTWGRASKFGVAAQNMWGGVAEEFDEPMNADSEAIVTHGTYIHEELQKSMENLFPDSMSEYAIVDYENKMTGHIDLVAPIKLTENSKPVPIPIEIKTVGGSSFEGLKEPKAEHVAQSQFYMHYLSKKYNTNVPYEAFIYVNRDNPSQYKVMYEKRNEKLFQMYLKRYRAYQEVAQEEGYSPQALTSNVTVAQQKIAQRGQREQLERSSGVNASFISTMVDEAVNAYSPTPFNRGISRSDDHSFDFDSPHKKVWKAPSAKLAAENTKSAAPRITALKSHSTYKMPMSGYNKRSHLGQQVKYDRRPVRSRQVNSSRAGV